MSIELTFSSFVHLIVVILGLLTSIILWVYPKNKYSYRRWLSASILSLSIGIGFGFIIETKLIYHVPHLYRLGNIFGYLFMPFSYIFIRHLISNKKVKYYDLVHAIPVALYIIDYIPFYLLPASQKIIELNQDLGELDDVLKFEEGWIFPAGFHLFFRTLTYAFYWILQVFIFTKFLLSNPKSASGKNKLWINWLNAYLLIQLLLFLPYFIVTFFGLQMSTWISGQIFAVGSYILTTGVLFFKPQILYGTSTIHSPSNGKSNGQSTFPTEGPHSLNTPYPPDIKLRLEKYILEQSPYLNHSYSLRDLAKDIDVPYYQLSIIINRNIGLNFNDFLNQYRIDHCKKMMAEGALKHMTLEAISYECGFNNRNSFTIAFKKFTGVTPSKYLKSYKG